MGGGTARLIGPTPGDETVLVARLVRIPGGHIQLKAGPIPSLGVLQVLNRNRDLEIIAVRLRHDGHAGVRRRLGSRALTTCTHLRLVQPKPKFVRLAGGGIGLQSQRLRFDRQTVQRKSFHVPRDLHRLVTLVRQANRHAAFRNLVT